MATVAKRRTTTKKVTAKPPVIDDHTWLLISYRRFSAERQKKGRSEDRQDQSWDEFVESEKRGHPDHTYLTHSLPMDRGMSALYGEHRKRGHLGVFVKGIESGDIKVIPGRTILFVEEVKRLSREGSKDALEKTIFKLFDAGITLQFKGGLQFNNEINKRIPGWLGMLSNLLDMAYWDSKDKKEWLEDVWKYKRKKAQETKELVVASVPYWLEIDGRKWEGDRVIESGKPKLIPAAGKALVKMFKWAAEGLGYDLIQQKLNHDVAKGGWQPRKRKNQLTQMWGRKYVQLTLKNRQVIGEFQPHRKVGGKYGKRVPDGPVILDFYPNVLKDHSGLFELVQQKLASKRGISQPGANKKCSNVVTGMARCGYCGGPMHYRPKGRGVVYLYCYESSGRKSPRCPMMPYEVCETALLDKLRQLKPESVLPKKDNQQKLCETLRREEQQLAAKVIEIQEQIDNYTDQIGRTKDAKARDAYENRNSKLRSESREVEKQRSQNRSRLQDAERDARSVNQWQEGLEALKAELSNGNKEIRPRLNDHLAQFIDRIEMFGKGYPDEFHDGSAGNLLEYFDAVELESFIQGHKPKKLSLREREQSKAFKNWALARLQTKHARFLRVHFREQGVIEENNKLRFAFPYIDIAPEGSIGGSSSAINTLWEEFKNDKKRQRLH